MKNKITCLQAKEISITAFLLQNGISPKKRYNGYSMYIAPYRNEKTPSLKVDHTKNLFMDFGTGKGGDIICLIQLMHNCTVSGALDILNGQTFSFHQQKKEPEKEGPKYSIDKIIPLENSNLVQYIQSRKIDLTIAKEYLVELHYSFSNNPKTYYGLGFKNNELGYEIRSSYFKGCFYKKGITSFFNNPITVCLFESWSDFLSYLTLTNNLKKESYIVLNSTSLINRVIPILKCFENIHCFLDNDIAGKNVLQEIRKNTNKKVTDYSYKYKNNKDLNEFLIHKKTEINQKGKEQGL
ncbi:MAG: hypothetical protein COB98_01590 [Flavobacteriaceae bacterium]|nr:MAG: hypothetical protein COB98_01590 [Flavobacteriaceae bacterium]